MFLWKAECVEMRLLGLGRGQRRRAERNLAGALLHLGGGKERKLLPIRTTDRVTNNPHFWNRYPK